MDPIGPSYDGTKSPSEVPSIFTFEILGGYHGLSRSLKSFFFLTGPPPYIQLATRSPAFGISNRALVDGLYEEGPNVYLL